MTSSARRLTLNDSWAGPQDPRVEDLLRVDIGAFADQLGATGAEVVVVTMPRVRNTVAPTPMPDPAPEPDAAQERLLQIEREQIRAGSPGPGFRENDDARVDHLNGILSGVAKDRNLRLLDLSALTPDLGRRRVRPRAAAPTASGFTDCRRQVRSASGSCPSSAPAAIRWRPQRLRR